MDRHADKARANEMLSATNRYSRTRTESGSGLSFLDARRHAVAQAKLRNSVNDSPRLAQLRALQAAANNRPRAKQVPRAQSAPRSGVNVVQRQIYIQDSNWNVSNGRASHVDATVYGETLPAGTNRPTVDPPGWDFLGTKYKMDNIVRMHLWNGRLGGPGNQTWNLAPGPSDVNLSDMAPEETNAQNALDQGHLLYLETNIAYGHSTDNRVPEYYYPSTIQFEWFSQDGNGNTVNGGNWGTNALPLPDEEDADYNSADYSSYDSDESWEDWS